MLHKLLWIFFFCFCFAYINCTCNTLVYIYNLTKKKGTPEFQAAPKQVQDAIMTRMSGVGQWGRRTIRALGISSDQQVLHL